MLKFNGVPNFEIPENATDEEYDAMKTIIMASVGTAEVTPDNVKLERIDVQAEEPHKYEINKECD